MSEISIMAVRLLPKQEARVRFSYLAPGIALMKKSFACYDK